ncbi:MAG: hypothetical protein B7733_12845 [Myxococcales bacterium FL481]|nr:MAG: hypothetical protein B7733_12845 [Myxococcales bacterium FL481]
MYDTILSSKAPFRSSRIIDLCVSCMSSMTYASSSPSFAAGSYSTFLLPMIVPSKKMCVNMWAFWAPESSVCT